jgi:hypothetical protein
MISVTMEIREVRIEIGAKAPDLTACANLIPGRGTSSGDERVTLVGQVGTPFVGCLSLKKNVATSPTRGKIQQSWTF